MRGSTMEFVTSSLSCGWRGLGYWVREYFGENAYPRYVATWQARHVGEPDAGVEDRLLTAREFFDLHLERTFGADIRRCC